MLQLCLFDGNAPRDGAGDVERMSECQSRSETTRPPTAWGQENSECKAQDRTLANANPPTIGPRSEITVSNEHITKDFMVSRGMAITWQ